MLELKKLHDSFMMHQAFAAAAAAAMNTLNTSSSSSSSSTGGGGGNGRGSQCSASSPSSSVNSATEHSPTTAQSRVPGELNVFTTSAPSNPPSDEDSISSPVYQNCVAKKRRSDEDSVNVDEEDDQLENELKSMSKKIKNNDQQNQLTATPAVEFDSDVDEVAAQDDEENEDEPDVVVDENLGSENEEDDSRNAENEASKALILNSQPIQSLKRKIIENSPSEFTKLPRLSTSKSRDNLATESANRKASSFLIHDILGGAGNTVGHLRPANGSLNNTQSKSFSTLPSHLSTLLASQPSLLPPSPSQAMFPILPPNIFNPALHNSPGFAEKLLEHYQMQQLLHHSQQQQQRLHQNSIIPPGLFPPPPPPPPPAFNPMDVFKLLAMNNSTNYEPNAAMFQNEQQLLFQKSISNLLQQQQFHHQQQQHKQQIQSHHQTCLNLNSKQSGFPEDKVKSSGSSVSKSVLSNPQKSVKQLHVKTEVTNEERKPTSSSASILSSLEKLTRSQFKDSTPTPNPLPPSSQTTVSKSDRKGQQSHGKSSEIVKSKEEKSVTASSEKTTSAGVDEGKKETSTNGAGGGNMWPAWVYCTRYSDRPSAGPRNRKKSKKILNKSIDIQKAISKTEPANVIANKTKHHSSSSSSNSSYSLTSPSQQQRPNACKSSTPTATSAANTSSPFLAAINSIISSTGPSPTKKPTKRPAPPLKPPTDFENSSSTNCFENDYTNDSNKSFNNVRNVTNDEYEYEEEDKFDCSGGGGSQAAGMDGEELAYDSDDDDDNDSNGSHSKRPRTAFTTSQLARLKSEFEKCKYLTGEKRQYLANELRLNESQIKIWFQNKRAKIKKSNGMKNSLAMQLMAQGLYNHRANNGGSK